MKSEKNKRTLVGKVRILREETQVRVKNKVIAEIEDLSLVEQNDPNNLFFA